MSNSLIDWERNIIYLAEVYKKKKTKKRKKK